MTLMLERPSRSINSRASPVWRGDESIPINRAPGIATAMGMRFPPRAQPSSSTRQLSTGGGANPDKIATVASWSGWLDRYGSFAYGISW